MPRIYVISQQLILVIAIDLTELQDANKVRMDHKGLIFIILAQLARLCFLSVAAQRLFFFKGNVFSYMRTFNSYETYA